MHYIIFKSLKNNKIKYYVILFILFLTINIIDSSAVLHMKTIGNKAINKSENKILYIISNDLTDKFRDIESIPNIQKISYNLDPIKVTSDIFEECYIKPLNFTTTFKSLLGKNKNFSNNEVILPKSLVEEYKIPLNNAINKKISFYIENQNVKLTISDIYEDENSRYIYIPENSILNKYIIHKNKYIIQVNNVNNISDIIKSIKDLNCNVVLDNDEYQNETMVYQDILEFIKDFKIIAKLILFIIFIVLVISNLLEKTNIIALLKSFGYNNIYIFNVLLAKELFLLIVSLINTMLIIKLIDISILSIFKLSGLINIKIILNNFIIMISIFLFVFIIISVVIKKTSIKKLLKT